MKRLFKKIKEKLFKNKKRISLAKNQSIIREPVLLREKLEFQSFSSPKVSIVIPFYNQENYTWTCLKSLYQNLSDRYSYEIILIDDNSPKKYDFSLAKNIRIIKNQTNLGFLRNINLGIKEAQGEYIYILNNDTIVLKGFLDELFYVFENYDNVGAVGSLLLNANHSLQEAGSAFLKDYQIHNIVREKTPESPEVNYIYKTDYCSGCSLLFKKFKDNRELNQFDEQFAPAYFEETDFCFDLRNIQNKEIYFTGFSRLYHFNGVSYNNKEKRKKKNTAKEELFTRNKSIFYNKWHKQIDEINAETVQERITEIRNNNSIVFFHTELPKHDADSGANRLKEIMDCFVASNFQVTIIADGTKKNDPYVEFYQRRGIMVYYESNAHNNYIDFLKRNTPKNSIIWYYAPESYKKYYSTSKEIFENGTFVYDMVDIHHLRIERTLEINPNDKWCKKHHIEYKEIELGLKDKVDYVIAVSDTEKEYMTKYYPEKMLLTVSNVHYLKTDPKVLPSFSKRKNLIFIGSTHHPNIDAVNWIIKDIMPLVWKKDPEIEVSIIGSVKNKIKNINKIDSRIKFEGFVPDVEEYFKNSKLMIAPLQTGAGVKGKIGQALEYCLPVVTTKVGAEGMFLEHEKGALLAETSEGLADEIIRACSDGVLWKKLSDNSENSLKPFSSERINQLISLHFVN